MIFTLIRIVDTILLTGTKIVNWVQGLRSVLIPQGIGRILDIVIPFIRKEIVLKSFIPSVSEPTEGKTKWRKPSIPKASGGMRFDAYITKERVFDAKGRNIAGGIMLGVSIAWKAALEVRNFMKNLFH